MSSTFKKPLSKTPLNANANGGHSKSDGLSKGTKATTNTTQPTPTPDVVESPYELSKAPRFLIVGAGNRGAAYARAIKNSTYGKVAAVADTNDYKRTSFGDKYRIPAELRFSDWRDLLTETAQAVIKESGGIDGVLVCTLDQTHAEIATSLIPFGWHILVEKPLATTYADCLKIQAAVEKANCIFAIGHVLRYSPHNMLLRRLLTEEKIVGDIIAVEHKEPVGWYHFSHSYVRGNWHKDDESGPSILTKCCHDLDVLLWILCSPKPFDPSDPSTKPHLPSNVYSTGRLTHFRPRNKPKNAGNNCISCPEAVERACMYSAKKIYLENPSGMRGGYNTEWPVNIVYPEVEEDVGNFETKEKELLRRLAEGPYGKCVYDGHNDVVDNQVVVMNWEEDENEDNEASGTRGPKTATLTMTAFSHAICERKTVVYGTKGELHSDTSWPAIPGAEARRRPMQQPQTSLHSISFGDPHAEWKTHTPGPADLFSGHGGGDTGLAAAFVSAVEAVKVHGWDVERAQREHIGAGIDEAVRAHGMAWCAEESRKTGQSLDWIKWHTKQVEKVE